MTTPTPLVAALLEQEAAWEARPLVRELYRSWFADVARSLAGVAGPSIELGSGIGKLRESIPDIVLTDVEPTPWASQVVDGTRLPFRNESVANLVLVDVYHHLASTSRFFDEADRVLAPGGRVVVVDPYCSWLSSRAYRRLHHEVTDLGAPPFVDDPDVERDPLASNQARATLELFGPTATFAARWPRLRILRRARFAYLAYPLSGGFGRRAFVPTPVGRALLRVEPLLGRLGAIAAFRCLVVLERMS